MTKLPTTPPHVSHNFVVDIMERAKETNLERRKVYLSKIRKPTRRIKQTIIPEPLPCNVDAISLGIHVNIVEDMMPTPNSEDEGNKRG